MASSTSNPNGEKRTDTFGASHSGSGGMTADQIFQKGLEHANSGDWRTAAKYFKSAAQLYPHSSPAFYSLAIAYLRSQPKGMSETQLKRVMENYRSLLVRAIELHDKHGGLKAEYFRHACLECASYYRQTRQHGKATDCLQLGLKGSPDDARLLESLASVLLDQQRFEAADKAVNRLLEEHPDSEEGRRLWKLIQAGLGKPRDIELPEVRKKEIYSAFQQATEEGWMTKETLDRMRSAGGFQESYDVMTQASSSAEKSAGEAVAARYGVSRFELSLIVAEGKRKSWPFHRADEGRVQRFMMDVSNLLDAAPWGVHSQLKGLVDRFRGGSPSPRKAAAPARSGAPAASVRGGDWSSLTCCPRCGKGVPSNLPSCAVCGGKLPQQRTGTPQGRAVTGSTKSKDAPVYLLFIFDRQPPGGVPGFIQAAIQKTYPGFTGNAQVVVSTSYNESAYVTGMAIGVAEKNGLKLATPFTYRTVSFSNGLNVTVVPMFR